MQFHIKLKGRKRTQEGVGLGPTTFVIRENEGGLKMIQVREESFKLIAATAVLIGGRISRIIRGKSKVSWGRIGRYRRT